MNRQEILQKFKDLLSIDATIKNITININIKFPESDCIYPDRREDNVINGNKFYWCLVLNRHNLKSFEVKYMKPYIWKNYDGSAEFAWVDEWGNYCSNIINPVHGDYDDWYVYGWFK